MFAITRKIVYKWRGVGDGVRNEAEDEVLSVEWLGRVLLFPSSLIKLERQRKRERERDGRERKERICPYDGARFVARGKILYQRSITTELCDRGNAATSCIFNVGPTYSHRPASYPPSKRRFLCPVVKT